MKTIEPAVEELREAEEDQSHEPAAEANSIEDQMSKNDAVYKSVEIDKEMMVNELNRLRAIYWEVQKTIFSTYDFGLLHLDCRSYKERLLKHCQELIDMLEQFNRSEFLSRMNLIQLEIQNVAGRL